MSATENQNETPAALGYRMPAEWEPHEATWIAWPHQHDDWPGKFAPIPWVYAEIVRHLSRVERVNILVKGRKMRAPRGRSARRSRGRSRAGHVRQGGHRPRLAPRLGPHVRGQADSGEGNPDGIGLVDWRFNGWAKYANHHHDNRVPRLLARRLGLRRWVPRVAVDGRARGGGS